MHQDSWYVLQAAKYFRQQAEAPSINPVRIQPTRRKK
jgi:hypothetical protein